MFQMFQTGMEMTTGFGNVDVIADFQESRLDGVRRNKYLFKYIMWKWRHWV